MDDENAKINNVDGFVCRVVLSEESASERLSLQEAALTPNSKNPEVIQRFKLGRIAAKRCLAEFGEERPQILRGAHGEPIFPDGFVGSISHTQTTAVAVVGRSTEFISLGVDIEKEDRVLTRNIIERIGTAQEKRWVKEGSREERALMIFCAKESLYKALFPLHGKRMNFLDVSVNWDEEHEAFISTLLTDFGAPWDAGATFLTLCQRVDGFIVAVTIIEQEPVQ